MKEKRKRGGQPGNKNALKHGYYSQAFKKADQADLELAAGVRGFDEEIALVRFKIKKALMEDNTADLMPLVKATGALEKLIRTDFRINGNTDKLSNGLKTVMREIILPSGNKEAAFQVIKRWCGYVEDENNLRNTTTNTPENEVDLP